LTITGIHEWIFRSCTKCCCAVLFLWYLVLSVHLSFQCQCKHRSHIVQQNSKSRLFFGTCLCNRKVRTKTRVPTVRSIVFVRWSGGRQMFLILGPRLEALHEQLRHLEFNGFLFLSYLDSFKDLVMDMLRTHEWLHHHRHWHELNWK
jgi:hypothetical protein